MIISARPVRTGFYPEQFKNLTWFPRCNFLGANNKSLTLQKNLKI